MQRITTLALTLLLGMAVEAAPDTPKWEIIKTKYPTADTVVAGFNVLDFGARGDGEKDCTKAFQTALDLMEKAGGGTVFVPEGKYVVKGNIVIPSSVTLRGEWQAPSPENPAVQGTVLMAYAGRGDAGGKPFILVNHSGGIKEMSIWYPEQACDRITPYPFCLEQEGGDNATFENLTLVNPYQGIKIGPDGNELHYAHNIYGTPLKVGIQYDSTTDIGRLENIHFSPSYWKQSGLPDAPAADSELEPWLLENGTGLHMLRSDWEYVAYIQVEGYRRGFFVSEGVRGAANAQFYGLTLKNCQTAVEVEKTNPFGMVFTKCSFEGSENGILVGDRFDSAILFSDCEIVSAKQAVQAKGNGCVIMQRCTVTGGDITVEGGSLAMTACRVTNPESTILLGSRMIGASLKENEIAGERSNIKIRADRSVVRISEKEVALDPLPLYDGNKTHIARPAQDKLFVIDASRGTDSQDDTRVIQHALDQAGEAGGGIVFIPAGDYVIEGRLSIPSGVELRGVNDVPHHTKGGGSILHIFPSSADEPTVLLAEASGMRGISFNYPKQRISELTEPPFLLQGRGRDIYVINVNCANAFRFLDLSTCRCDNHYVDYLSGAPLSTGIAVGGGSTGGEIRNVQFNTHYWNRVPSRSRFFNNSPSGSALRGSNSEATMLWTYQKEHLDALVVGDCQNELLFQNFVYGSLYGIHFIEQNGKGAANCICHGHGTDGSKIGVFFEGGDSRITMINSELVSMSSADKTAIKLGSEFKGNAAFLGTLVWGSPDLLAEVDSGTLLLQGLHCNRHGNGIQINGGLARLINVNFADPKGGHVAITNPDAQVELSGCITAGSLLVNGKPFDEKKSSESIMADGNIQGPRSK